MRGQGKGGIMGGSNNKSLFKKPYENLLPQKLPKLYLYEGI